MPHTSRLSIVGATLLGLLLLPGCSIERSGGTRSRSSVPVKWPALEPVDPAKKHSMLVDYGVMVPMRDGVLLSADIYRPDAPGQYPVILSRTPYNKAGAGEGSIKRYRSYVERGYVVVVQDVRGARRFGGGVSPVVPGGGTTGTTRWSGAGRSRGRAARWE
jgi:hypothetical protein